jgi:uncharacterized protein
VGGEKDRKQHAVACSLLSFIALFASLLQQPASAVAISIIFSGCTVLSPRQDNTRFILLTPTTPARSNGTLTASPNVSAVAIGLGPVSLPEYLDRPELVIRTSPNGFDLSEIDRWAEPLADNFRHVLASDLTTVLGGGNIVEYPWYAGTRLDYIVQVQVEHFEAAANRSAQLSARWQLKTSKGDEVLASHEPRFNRIVDSLEGDTVAAALSTEIGALAEQIASALVQAEQQRVARGEVR